jgi:hypothetical protein
MTELIPDSPIKAEEPDYTQGEPILYLEIQVRVETPEGYRHPNLERWVYETEEGYKVERIMGGYGEIDTLYDIPYVGDSLLAMYHTPRSEEYAIPMTGLVNIMEHLKTQNEDIERRPEDREDYGLGVSDELPQVADLTFKNDGEIITSHIMIGAFQ